MSSNNTILILSNAPEEWHEQTGQRDWSGPTTIYKFQVALVANVEQEVVLYAWHDSRIRSDRNLTLMGVVLDEDKDKNVQVLDLKKYVATNQGLGPEPFRVVGRCVAFQQLFGPSGLSSSNLTIDSEQPILNVPVTTVQEPYGRLVCALAWLKLKGNADLTFGMRLVVRTGSYGNFGDPVTAPNNTLPRGTIHNRGFWKGSKATFGLNGATSELRFDVNPASERPAALQYSLIKASQTPPNQSYETSSWENRFGNSRPYDANAGTEPGNCGLYGANVSYRVWLKNSALTPQTLSLVPCSPKRCTKPFFRCSSGKPWSKPKPCSNRPRHCLGH